MLHVFGLCLQEAGETNVFCNQCIRRKSPVLIHSMFNTISLNLRLSLASPPPILETFDVFQPEVRRVFAFGWRRRNDNQRYKNSTIYRRTAPVCDMS